MQTTRSIFLTLATFGLAACVANEPPAGGAAPTPTAASAAARGAAGTRFDGTYSGVLGAPTASGPSSSACYFSGNPQTLRVTNGQLRGGVFFRRFDGALGADGSFNLTGPDTRNNGNPGTIEGRATGTNLDGSFTFRVGTRTTCTYSMSGMTRG